jgi:hypothetical protein
MPQQRRDVVLSERHQAGLRTHQHLLSATRRHIEQLDPIDAQVREPAPIPMPASALRSWNALLPPIERLSPWLRGHPV